MNLMMMLWLFYVCILCISVSEGVNVTYDSRSLIIDGQRKLIIAAAIHYPRSVPGVIKSISSLILTSRFADMLKS